MIPSDEAAKLKRPPSGLLRCDLEHSLKIDKMLYRAPYWGEYETLMKEFMKRLVFLYGLSGDLENYGEEAYNHFEKAFVRTKPTVSETV